jgi:hypothetical protein
VAVRAGCAGWSVQPNGSRQEFDEPITDSGSDEVARTFDRMRQRLAQLDHARREFIANASHERTPVTRSAASWNPADSLDEGPPRDSRR